MAKEAAWAQIISGELPNAVFRATLDGFTDPDHAELLEPYGQRFFDEVGRAWSDWGADMAQWFAANAYPSYLITPAAIAMADDYTARSDLPAPLRRLLSEGRDDVARALRCQQRDAAAAS
jgi:aminopeptidase N